MDSETKRFIIHEIRRQVNIITSGTSGKTTTHTESIKDRYPGMPEIPDRPIMQPFGFASKAPEGLISVTAQQGDHPGNVLTLGHRDKNKPSDLAVGESAQYSVGKYQVRCLNEKIQVGKNGVWETVVVGDTLNTLLIALLDAIIAHKHLGNLGFSTSPPDNLPDFQTIKNDSLTPEKILAKDGGKF